MPDAHRPFAVVLEDLQAAIDVMNAENERIADVLGQMRTAFRNVDYRWRSPAGTTLGSLTTEFETDAEALNDMLSDIVRRLRQTRRNYQRADDVSGKNLEH